MHRRSEHSHYKDALDFLKRIVREVGRKDESQLVNLFNGNDRLVQAQLDQWKEKGLVKPERLSVKERKIVERPRPRISPFYRLDTVNRNGRKILVARAKNGRFVKLTSS